MITDKLAKELRRYRFDRICVTLDGSQKITHEKHRGVNTFEKVIAGIKKLQSHKLPVSTLFTLNKDNADDLIDTIRLNEKLGITYMTVMMLCPTGRASGAELLVEKEQWYKLFMTLTEMKLKNKIALNFKIVPPNEGSIHWQFYYPLKHYDKLDLLYLWQPELYKKSLAREISCHAGTRAASIDQNGDVYGCDLMMGINEFVAGNIRKQSLSEIWQTSPVFSAFREFNFSSIKGKCAMCANEWCGGGCRASAYNLSGNYYGSDIVCYEEENK